jgi:hypothetical protein
VDRSIILSGSLELGILRTLELINDLWRVASRLNTTTQFTQRGWRVTGRRVIGV